MKAGHVGCIVLACLLAFSNVFTNGFHLDDGYRIEKNPGVQQFASPFRHFIDPSTSSQSPRLVQYRPLLPLSLSINYAISGDSLVGYHIGNLLFQIMASVLVYFLVSELLTHWTEPHLSPHTPLLIALLFAIHPVSGVPVNYLCSRDLILMQLFMVGSLLAYVRMRRLGDGLIRWIGCLLLLSCSLLAKKNVVVLPAIIGLFELLFTKGSWHRVWRVLPFAVVIGSFLLFVRHGLGFSDFDTIVPASLSWLEYGEHQLQHHVFHYLRNFVWPIPIRIDAVDPIESWKSVVGGVGVAVSWILAGYWRRRRPVLTFGILGYQVMLLLTSSVVPLHNEIVPYRPYPASLFLFLCAGVLVAGLFHRSSKVPTLVAGVIAVYFGGMSVYMNRIWRDEITLGQHTVEYGGNHRAHYNLANSLPMEHTEKFVHFDRALEIAPDCIPAHIGYGMAECKRGNVTRGIQRLRESVARDRTQAQSYYYLAQGLTVYTTDLQGAADAAARASELEPRNILHRYYAAQRALAVKRFEVAIRLLEPIDRSFPGHRYTQFLLGIAYLQLQDWQHAIEHFKKCLTLYTNEPRMREVHRYLVECYGATGNKDAARKHQSLYDKSRK